MMTPTPLSGHRVVECLRPDSDDVTRVSIAFAGRIAAGLGADVVRVLPDGTDPMDGWGPILPDGRSAMSTFLSAGKEYAAQPPGGEADLLTNDPDRAANWSAGSAILVRSSLGDEAHSELTILAASGLLDIFGEPYRPPLPMPGHQAAYSAGLAAFNALVAGIVGGAGRGGPGGRSHSAVSVVDVATWLNWKHYLAARFNHPNAGIGRREDWTTVRCRDGHIAVVFQDKDVPRLADMIGDERLRAPDFATLGRRRENVQAFTAIVAGWARDRGRDEILAEAARLALPFGPVLTVADLITDRQMLARQFIDLTRSSAAYGQPRLPAAWYAATPYPANSYPAA